MKSNLSRWLNGLVGQIIEGASDAFLIVAGGSAAIQTTSAGAQPIDLKHIGVSMAFGAGIYAASFLKKTPTPDSMPDLPAPAAVVNPPAN
jgi:glycerol uptake facilitator-like aquaporin